MIKEPMVMEIAKNTYAINEFCLSACYFLVGEERALLIDTACGLSDLKGIAASLTDKPYDVVLTHGHLDHVGGIGAFTDVYLGEADFAMTRNLNAEQLRGFADEIGRNGGYQAYEYDLNKIQPFEMPTFHALHEGDVFELGTAASSASRWPATRRAASVFLMKRRKSCSPAMPATRIFLSSAAA